MSKKRKRTDIDWSEELRAARRDMDTNRRAVESGETFRAHQSLTRKSPSANRSRW